MCQSFTVTDKGGRFVDDVPPIDLRNLLTNLPNLVRLDLTGSTLVRAFFEYCTARLQDDRLPTLRTLALTVPTEQVDHSFPFPIEGLYPFHHLDTLALALPYLSRGNDSEPGPSFPSLRHLAFKFRIVHDLTGITRIIEGSPALRQLEVHDYSPQRNFRRLLEAAARLGTVDDLTLEGAPYAGRWKVPTEVGSFTVLTKLSLSHGCSARHAPTFTLFRRLPLESLSFGPRTKPSGSRLVKLATGPTKLPTLRFLHLDNIEPGYCHEIDFASAQKAELKKWQDKGWGFAWFACSFSPDHFWQLETAAASGGAGLTGRTVEAAETNRRIWDVKSGVKRRLKELKKVEREASALRVLVKRGRHETKSGRPTSM
ncbi:hypothetical protein JCM10295v2_006216 [Rhodotorula toruloides]